jgi:alkylmercury lyase
MSSDLDRQAASHSDHTTGTRRAGRVIGSRKVEPLAVLAAGLSASLGPQLADPIFLAALRALVGGQPVSADALSRTLGVPVATVAARIAATPNLETDDAGRIVGAALTLQPTSHRVRLRGRTLYTWCAFDLLLLPHLLGEALEAETVDPVTRTMIHLAVGPEGVASAAPAQVVAAVVTPDAAAACCGVRGAFCDHAHFFTDEGAAGRWLAGRGLTARGVTLPLDDAFTLARLLADRAGAVADRATPADFATAAVPCAVGQGPGEPFDRPTSE